MAKPTKSSETKITRIKASDEPRAKKTASPKPTAASKTNKTTVKTSEPKTEKVVREKKPNPLGPIGRYFKGAWEELRQVRWPDRKTTWGMTGALLAFTAFFVVIILLLDAAFAELFNLLLGR